MMNEDGMNEDGAISALSPLLQNNRAWAEQIEANDPGFFKRLSHLQSPDYLWIGCSDSRVPANTIVGLPPGAVFVHRNVANVVVHTDLNCLSVVQVAVDVLAVKHIIICGHYGCGGIRAALFDERHGLVDNWLRHVRDVRQHHAQTLARLADDPARCDRLCELNVIEQVVNICGTTVLRDAWMRGREVAVHGVIYGLSDGRLKWLEISVNAPEDVEPAYARALAGLGSSQ